MALELICLTKKMESPGAGRGGAGYGVVWCPFDEQMKNLSNCNILVASRETHQRNRTEIELTGSE